MACRAQVRDRCTPPPARTTALLTAAVVVAGKTLLAKAVANQTSATFLRVVGSELIQKYATLLH